MNVDVHMFGIIFLIVSIVQTSVAKLPCDGVSISECGYDGLIMELAFECENDCKELCDKTQDCSFFKWRHSSPLKSCKLYNISFTEHIDNCNIIGGPGNSEGSFDYEDVDDVNDHTSFLTCDFHNLTESCDVFMKGDCTVHMSTELVKSSLFEWVTNMPTEGICQNKCNGAWQCKHWQYTRDKSLCHRWIPRGWQDNKIPEYQEDEIVEVCDSYYAPQHTDKCKCDESLECDEDLSSAFVIAGGTNSFVDKIFFSDKVELFQPETETSYRKSCMLPKLPQNRTEPTVNIVDGSLVVCGGDGGEHSCLELQKTGWIETGFDMITPRTGHVSWVAENSHVVLSGGIYSQEAVFGYEEGTPFAAHMERACALQVDDDQVIIIGGRDRTGWNSVSRRVDGYVEALPPLLVGRSHHACGLVEMEDKSKLLVVAGGYNDNYEALDTIEVLRMDSDNVGNWETLETRLPRPLNGFKMENVGEKLYIVGGKDDNNEANTEVVIFDPVSSKFSTIQGYTSQPHWNHGMSKVQRTSFEEYCMN